VQRTVKVDGGVIIKRKTLSSSIKDKNEGDQGSQGLNTVLGRRKKKKGPRRSWGTPRLARGRKGLRFLEVSGAHGIQKPAKINRKKPFSATENRQRRKSKEQPLSHALRKITTKGPMCILDRERGVKISLLQTRADTGKRNSASSESTSTRAGG